MSKVISPIPILINRLNTVDHTVVGSPITRAPNPVHDEYPNTLHRSKSMTELREL